MALSGGLDSCVLLHALAALPTARARGLRALHVHHGLHAQADAWSMHCQVLCDALDVSLRIARVEVDRDSGTGIEAAARHARHGAFEAELGTDQVLVLAHHRDDQAETFLLRALRASGADGLGAMRRRRTFGRGRLWRPLLDHPRTALLEYAQAHGLRWIDDPTNADPSLDRNFLRHRVLPLLRERWPQADAAFAVSAALCAEAATLLADEDAHALAGVRSVDPNALDVDRLQALPRPRRARVLRRWIETLALPPLPAQGVARIEHDLLAAAPDSDAAFAWSGAVVRRWRDILHADWRREPLPKDWTSGWDGRAPLALPDGGELTLEGTAGFDEPVRVHAREGGERIVLPGRGHTHALKHALQDLGVPPWERTRLPLLSSHDTLLAAGDLLYSAVFDAWLRARGARLVWAPASAPTA
ncbi:tRNA(Ile)-lysidine synthase [Luteimonas cucumeris]|uniref:tRNA(Ile)-lysidine synthase n=1 Tax=Luteimonas cucumeris TaxID=985012 RepID=A0A562LBA8_9GAMM|nr:tRNA(Ile)-lysidine synthase [Luteimonas cucumeris]